MEPIELLAFATSALERLGLRYLVTGSMATIAYGEPRFTNDIDLKKLLYFQEGGSDKHVRDILGVLRILGDKVDRTSIDEWAGRLGVMAEWQRVRDQAD